MFITNNLTSAFVHLYLFAGLLVYAISLECPLKMPRAFTFRFSKDVHYQESPVYFKVIYAGGNDNDMSKNTRAGLYMGLEWLKMVVAIELCLARLVKVTRDLSIRALNIACHTVEASVLSSWQGF